MIVGYKEIWANLHCEILEINHYNVGGLAYFITHSNPKHFQPMNTNFGVIMSNINRQICKNKLELVNNSLEYINKIKGEINGTT